MLQRRLKRLITAYGCQPLYPTSHNRIRPSSCLLKELNALINAFLDNSLNLIRDLKPRRRARFSRQLKSCLVSRQDGKCAYCGVELHTRGRERNLSIDHKHPVSADGTNEKSNLQAICRQCNSWKDDHTDGEFEERIKRGRQKLGIKIGRAHV